VRFGPQGVADVQSVALEDALAWRGGRYTFYQARLADVVAEIERYRKGRILVMGSSLADERVTGSFSLDDTDAALQSLQASVGFNLHSLGGRLTIIGP
jgi:transmembrane sensor